MKKTLAEELERIHSITYGKRVLEEQGILDKMLSAVGLKGDKDKVDDPKKADLVSTDVDEFFKTLEKASEGNGISQQEKGSMNFQKEVESMQIGLILLGYGLPKYGVDGLFGPETAAAVRKFKSDNVTINETASALRSTLDTLGYDEKGNELSSGGDISTEISKITSDILKQYKTVKPDVDVIVTAGNDKFHKGLSYTSKHTLGQAVDLTLKPYNSENAKAFIEILKQFQSKDSKFSFIDEYTNPTKAATGGHFHLQYGEGKGGSNVPLEVATPEMLKKLIDMLKSRGVKSEDLKKYIDQFNLEGLADKNFYAKLLENLGAPITEENLKFLYAWRQAEGSGGTYNPFNTTWNLPGSVSINSHGVKSYKSLEDGMIATVKTLRNGKYTCIVEGLRNDIGAENIAKCGSLKTWGTGDLVAKVVSSYNRGATPKIKDLA